MDFIRDQPGRTSSTEDPNLWVQRFGPDPRMDQPYRFIISIDDRKIGLAIAKSISSTPRSEDLQKQFDRPTIIIREIGLPVRGQLTVDQLETTASKFASREQQDRAIEFFLGAVRHYPPGRHVTGEILTPQARFAPEIWVRLERGDFIE